MIVYESRECSICHLRSKIMSIRVAQPCSDENEPLLSSSLLLATLKHAHLETTLSVFTFHTVII